DSNFAQSQSTRLVLPLDLFNPELVAALRKGFPSLALRDIRGGVPLHPVWNAQILASAPPSDARTESVSIGALNAFLAHPQIPVGDVPRDVTLSQVNVRDLLSKGSTFVTLSVNERPVLYELKATPPALLEPHVAPIGSV